MNSTYRNEFSKSVAAATAIFCALIVTFPASVNAGPEAKSGPLVSLTTPFDWTGFYIGGNLGGILSDSEFGSYETFVDTEQQFFGGSAFSDDAGVLFFTPSDNDVKNGAVIGGGQIGYNRQFGHFVVGVEGDFNRTSTGTTATFRQQADFANDVGVSTFFDEPDTITALTDFKSTRKAETNWIASARARLGFAHGRLLFYATGGPAWADTTVTRNDIASTNFFRDIAVAGRSSVSFDPPPGPPGTEFNGNVTNSRVGQDGDTRFGWTAGAGIEIAFNDAVSLGMEYRHNDFGGEGHRFSDDSGPIFSESNHLDLESDQVTFRFNVLLSHFFGHQNYASTPAGVESGPDENMSATAGAEKLSAKDKNIAVMPPEETFSWTGFYIGANVGGIWTDYDFNHFDTAVDVGQQTNIFLAEAGSGPQFSPGEEVLFFETPGFDDSSDDSILGGGQLGYQFQFGHFVAGVEADFQGMASSAQQTFQSDTQFSIFGPPGQEFGSADTNLQTWRQVDSNWQGSARARFGYARGRVLLYVTGGGVWNGSTVRTKDVATTNIFDSPAFLNFVGTVKSKYDRTDGDVAGGWTAGGGAEWAFSSIASLGLEYRHNDVGDHTFKDRKHEDSAVSAGSTGVDLASDQVTVRVNFLLGNVR